MRILVCSAYFESHRGGIEIVAGKLAREFGGLGHSVSWLAADASSPPAGTDAVGRVVPLRASNASERWLQIPQPIPALRAFRIIKSEVARADVVHVHDALYLAHLLALMLARWHGKPVVLTQHIAAIPYRNRVLRLMMRAMNRLLTRPMLACADQVVFISHLTAKAFQDVNYRRPPRMIFNGVDTGLFRPASNAAEKAKSRDRFQLAQHRPVALFVGRFVEKKGLDVLRRAAALGSDIDWVFAGWGGLDPTAWGLANVIVCRSLTQATLAPLYRASDVLVLPSTGEGLPLVLQEAMASGLACVLNAETAAADDRLDGLIDPVVLDRGDTLNNAAAVLQAVRVALARNRPEQSQQRFECMRAWYSWPAAARHYEGIFERVIADRRLLRDGTASPGPAAGARS
jgi:glycosyltransferase involved in cell wall biosynthesis